MIHCDRRCGSCPNARKRKNGDFFCVLYGIQVRPERKKT